MIWFVLPALASDAYQAWSDDFARSGCHRDAVQALVRDWGELSSAERRAVHARHPALAMPEAPPGSLTCQAVPGDHQWVTEHFVVSWDDGVVDEAGAIAVGDALERSWTRLFDELGWAPPAGSDRWHLSVHLSADRFEGGFATETVCGGEALPVIVIGAGTFDWGTWYQDVAAHELLHASHYRYGRAFDSWWWEATSIWVQEQVFPDNDEWAYYVDFFVAHPYWSLTTSTYVGDEARHMYGSALWVFWLEQEHGGPDFVRTLWERSSTLPGDEAAEMADVLAPEIDMVETFVAFAEAMVIHGIGEGERYDSPAHEPVATLPAHGGPPPAQRPEPWGMHYVRFHDEALPPEGLSVAVEADPGVAVSLLGVRGGAVVRRGELLDGHWVLGDGTSLDEAWLVAVNTGEIRQPVAWTADRVGGTPEPTTPTTPTTPAAPTADTGPVDTAQPPGGSAGPTAGDEGCGCGSAPAGPGWAWLARRRPSSR